MKTMSRVKHEVYEDIEWQSVIYRSKVGGLEGIQVSFYQPSPKKSPICTIRFGYDICEKMEYKLKDQLDVLFNPKNAFQLCVIKRPERGYVLQPAGKNILELKFSWRLTKSVDTTEKYYPSYHIDGEKLIFSLA